MEDNLNYFEVKPRFNWQIWSLFSVALGLVAVVSISNQMQNRQPPKTTVAAAAAPIISSMSLDTSSVYVGLLQATFRGQTPIIRIGTGMDSGGFSNPDDYVRALKAINAQVSRDVYAVAGPNEPETERWVAPNCADGDGACIGPYVTAYMNKVIAGAGTLSHIKLLSPEFNLCSDRYPALWAGMNTASPNWGGLYGLAINVYDYTTVPAPYNRISTCIDARIGEGRLPASKPIIIAETGAYTRNFAELASQITKITASTYQGGRIKAVLLFNAFGLNPDPSFTWSIVDDATIKTVICGNGLCSAKKVGVNFATVYSKGDYVRATALNMGFTGEIYMNGSTVMTATKVNTPTPSLKPTPTMSVKNVLPTIVLKNKGMVTPTPIRARTLGVTTAAAEQSLTDGQVVSSGVVKLMADTDINTTYVDLVVDGVLDKTILPVAGTSTIVSPQAVYWDPSPYTHGLHKLEVKAYQPSNPSGIVSAARYLFVKKDASSLKPYGRITGISNGVVSGCAVDVDDPTKAIQVGFTVDRVWGASTGFDDTVTAGLNDTATNNCDYPGTHGFAWTIPGKYKDGAVHNIYVTGMDLSGATYYNNLTNSPQSYQGTLPSATPVPTNPPVPTTLPTQVPPVSCAAADWRSWDISANFVCENGWRVNSANLDTVRLNYQQTFGTGLSNSWFYGSYSTANPNNFPRIYGCANSASAPYATYIYADDQAGNTLTPMSPFPSTAFTVAGVGSGTGLRWFFTGLPSGNYKINFLLPTRYCLAPTATPAPTPTAVPISYIPINPSIHP